MSYLITIIKADGSRMQPYPAIGDAQALQADAYDNKDAYGLVMLVVA